MKLIPDFLLTREDSEYLKQVWRRLGVYEVDSAKRVSVKLKTRAEYAPIFEEKDKFLIVQSEEITDGFDKKPVHINAINVKEAILPRGGSSVTEVMQNNLDAVHEQRQRTGQAMFAHINHPNFMWGISLQDMMKLNGDRFFEIYNGPYGTQLRRFHPAGYRGDVGFIADQWRQKEQAPAVWTGDR